MPIKPRDKVRLNSKAKSGFTAYCQKFCNGKREVGYLEIDAALGRYLIEKVGQSTLASAKELLGIEWVPGPPNSGSHMNIGKMISGIQPVSQTVVGIIAMVIDQPESDLVGEGAGGADLGEPVMANDVMIDAETRRPDLVNMQLTLSPRQHGRNRVESTPDVVQQVGVNPRVFFTYDTFEFVDGQMRDERQVHLHAAALELDPGVGFVPDESILALEEDEVVGAIQVSYAGPKNGRNRWKVQHSKQSGKKAEDPLANLRINDLCDLVGMLDGSAYLAVTIDRSCIHIPMDEADGKDLSIDRMKDRIRNMVLEDAIIDAMERQGQGWGVVARCPIEVSEETSDEN